MPKHVANSSAQYSLSDEQFIVMIIKINVIDGSDGWRIGNDASRCLL